MKTGVWTYVGIAADVLFIRFPQNLHTVLISFSALGLLTPWGNPTTISLLFQYNTIPLSPLQILCITDFA